MQYRIPCAVSYELLEMIAEIFPDKYVRSDGKVKVNELLFDIGFKISNDGMTRGCGYLLTPNVYIRDNHLPARAYKTKGVFVGEVRNIIKCYKNGVPEYTRQLHPLYRLYSQYEVIHPKLLDNYVATEDFITAIDIGEAVVYDTCSM